MNKEIISKIIDRINEKLTKKECPISEENFKKIESIESNKKIVFIDGGQAEFIKAVDFSLQFIRVAALTFRNNKKIETKINEFFVLITAVEENENIKFETEIFPVKGDITTNISINSLDSTIKKGNERAEISDIGGMVRRFSELRLAQNIANELEEGSIVVMDGNLKSIVKGEDEYLKELLEIGIKKGVIITSLAKTSRLFMGKGACLLSNLNEKGSKEYPWYYDFKERAVVKLNKASEYVFEFDINEQQKQKMKEVLGILASCSNDVVFAGYPYGLLMADKIARVDNHEKEFLLTLFQARAGNSWKRLRMAVNALNSHDKLDSI